MRSVRHVPDGHEAYRDDSAYTAPEMRPGKGVDVKPDSWLQIDLGVGAGLTIGAAGGALAGELLREEKVTPTIDRRF
jgi:hypothetical protein